jgi:phosphoglycerate-specific signal transduction histidine kinase
MDNDFISAFAFKIGRQIEQLIKEKTNNLEERNQMLEAKILDWYAKNKDEKFAEHFGVKKALEGRF